MDYKVMVITEQGMLVEYGEITNVKSVDEAKSKIHATPQLRTRRVFLVNFTSIIKAQ